MAWMSAVSGLVRIFGSTKKVTGSSALSPGASACSVKQKHWILLKYWPESNGVTLNVADPTVGRADRFLTRKTAVTLSPSAIVTAGTSGTKLQGSVLLTLASSRTVMVAAEAVSGARSAVRVAP